MVYNPPHTTKQTAGQRGVMCKMYAGVCKILWSYPTLLKHLYINLLRTKSVRWQWKHTHSFTSRLTGRKQIFGYKLHTSFDGCNASARPLQRFCTKPICVGDYCYPVKPLWYYGSRIAPIARIFFAHTTCYNTTEMTDFTDFVSIACSLRYWPVTYPWRNMLAQIM